MDHRILILNFDLLLENYGNWKVNNCNTNSSLAAFSFIDYSPSCIQIPTFYFLLLFSFYRYVELGFFLLNKKPELHVGMKVSISIEKQTTIICCLIFFFSCLVGQRVEIKWG